MLKVACPTSAVKSTLLAFTLSLCAFSLNAHATLTSYTNAGADLVYSSVSDVTWTKDGNLLRTLISSQGSTVVNAIIAAGAANGMTVTSSDFSSSGGATWLGTQAYVSYLNSINYGGSNQWYLPNVANAIYGFNTATNGTVKGDELPELYYQELGTTNGSGIQDPQNIFVNELSWAYWTGSEWAPSPADNAWLFYTYNGYQGTNYKGNQFYAWAATAGDLRTSAVSAVPLPAAAWLFGSGLVGLAGLRRRQQSV